MRLLLWLLLLAGLAVGLALVARSNDGYALLVLPPWRVELSLNLLILLQLAAFCLAYLLLRLLDHTLALPRSVREYRARRARAQAEQALVDSFRYYFEGRYGRALKSASAAYVAAHAPGLAALMAARCAHALRSPEREAYWLARAIHHDGESRNARLMTEGELYLQSHRYAEAQASLDVLAAGGQRHIAALRLALRNQRALGDWREVLRLIRLLEKTRALSAEQALPLKLQAHQEVLRAVALDAGALVQYWRTLPVAERRSPKLCAEAATLLIAAGDCTTAQSLIEDALDQEWNGELILIYAHCQGGDVLGRIARAEAWLTGEPRDANLLLALGRLCRQQKLWGKAQSYVDASLSLAPTREAHVEMAQLLEQLDRAELAARHYRAAAELGGARPARLAVDPRPE